MSLVRKLISAPKREPGLTEWRAECKEKIGLWQELQRRSYYRNILRIPTSWEMQNHSLLLEEEWLPGKDLRAFAATDRSIFKTKTLALLAAAAEKLGLLHTERFLFSNCSGRIVHGDISPKNLIITENGLVIWIDAENLRFARNPKICPMNKIFQAKPAYLAPEYARSGILDQSAEIFALGAIAWELLRGTPLFAHEKRGHRQAISFEMPAYIDCLERVPKQFQQLIRRSLHPDPDNRFSTAVDFSLELQRALAQFY